MKPDTARLFLGLELSGEARRALDDVRRSYLGQGVQGKFHGMELYHLTLCFLGYMPVSEIPYLRQIMDSVSCQPFVLTLDEPGTFKNGSILWAGVERCDALTEYRERLADALRNAGFPLEEGEYRPHITLARQIKTALPAVSIPKISFDAQHAVLFESTRVEGALCYIPIYRSVFH